MNVHSALADLVHRAAEDENVYMAEFEALSTIADCVLRGPVTVRGVSQLRGLLKSFEESRDDYGIPQYYKTELRRITDYAAVSILAAYSGTNRRD